MKYLILICLLISSCNTMTTSSQPDAVTGLQELLEETNPETGEPFTLKEATAIQQAANQVNEQESFMDRLLSTKIMILFVITAIGMVIAAGVAFQRGNIPAAIVWASTGAVILLLPVLLIVFFKAMMFLLYVFYGLVIVGIAVVIWKVGTNLKDKHTALEGVVGTMEQLKDKYPNEWSLFKEDGFEQCAVTVEAVKDIKKK